MTLQDLKSKLFALISIVLTNAMAIVAASIIEHSLAFLLIATLMIVDVFTGIWKSIKSKKKIRSTIMFWGIIHKMMMLIIVLVLSMVVKNTVNYDITNYLLIIGCIIEMRSIDENMTEATGFNFERYIFVQIDKILRIKNKWMELKKNENENESNNNDNSTNHC